MILRWIVLTVLAGFAGLNSIGIGRRRAGRERIERMVRCRSASRTELAIVAILAFYAFTAGSVFVLGFASLLTALNVGVLSLAIAASRSGSSLATGHGEKHLRHG